jgi:acylpyruvate hydrolase
MAAAVTPGELGLFIESGPRAIEGVERALDHLASRAADKLGPRGERLLEPLSEVKVHPPYAKRARLMMAGANYVSHSAGMSRDGGPARSWEEMRAASKARGLWGFYCFTENAVGTGDNIIYPTRTDRLDYEGEVAVIVGKKGKDIRADRAEPFFWGYILQNDVSARTTLPVADNPQTSFHRGKNFDSSIAGGPYIAVGEFPDAQDIDWETRVNGEVRQQGNTKEMTFSFAELLAYISEDMTLLPGDVFSAGTTAGTAQDSSPVMEGQEASGQQAKRDPRLFLKPGDVVEISNPVMGVLRNQVVAKEPAD